MDEYNTNVFCNNCSELSTIRIPKGTLKSDLDTDEIECPNCGCEGECHFT